MTRTMAIVLVAMAFAADPSLADAVKDVVKDAGNAGTGKVPSPMELAAAISGLFVVATVMEAALATLFNWRLYREFFNGRAVKTLVMIGFGYAIVRTFEYDIFSKIIDLVHAKGDADPRLSQFLSALVLAGGSAAVFELFKALGLRPPVESAEAKPQPAQDKAWVSVRIIRRRAIGDVWIHFEEVPSTPGAAGDEIVPDPYPLATVIRRKSFLERLRGVFFADPMRFPSYGGRTVDTSKVYRIVATGWQRGENPGDPDRKLAETIYCGRFAGRAIVDFTWML